MKKTVNSLPDTTQPTHEFAVATSEDDNLLSDKEKKGSKLWKNTSYQTFLGKDGCSDYETAITICGYGKFHYFLLFALLPACCAQVFSSNSMSYVIPVAECDLKLTNTDKGALNAAAYVGLTIGALFGGFASDVFGRRKLIVIGHFAASVFNVMASLSYNFWLLLVMKIFSGFSITGPIASVLSFAAETHSNRYRSMVLMIHGGLSALAQTILPAIAYYFIPIDFHNDLIPGALDFNSWRLFLLISALPGFLASFIFSFFPESPKFLMMKGRTEEALHSFKRIYAMNTGKPGHTYPVQNLEIPAAKQPMTPKGGVFQIFTNGWRQIRPIFRPPYLNTALVVFGINACIMLSMNSVRMWVPQLFTTLNEAKNMNITGATTICSLIGSVVHVAPSRSDFNQEGHVCPPVDSEVYIRSLIVGAAAALSYFITVPIFRWVGKRNFAKLCFPTVAVVAISINWATNEDTFTVLLALYTALIRNAFSTMSTISVDLFPTAFRTLALSMTMMCGRIASVAGNLLFPVLLDMGCSVVFFSLGGILGLASALVWLISNKTETL